LCCWDPFSADATGTEAGPKAPRGKERPGRAERKKGREEERPRGRKRENIVQTGRNRSMNSVAADSPLSRGESVLLLGSLFTLATSLVSFVAL
jgi:hypothetical protein